MRGDRHQCFVKYQMIFFIPDGKISRLSQVVSTWTSGRLTPDGNEGVGVEIPYLEHAYGTKYYIVD